MKFHKAVFEESEAPLGNPDCGWYHIYPFTFKEVSGTVFPPLDAELLSGSLRENSGERLALLQFDIGFFREEDLTPGVLRRMEQVLQCFRAAGKQLILRVAYDLEGKGLLRDPESEERIHRHMEQLGPLLCAYASDILTLQGVFVGNWGEMHGSRFLTGPAVARLVRSLYRASGGMCFLAVRTPAQWRGVMARLGGEPGLAEKLTLFNDGLFGSETDLGTYGAPRAGGADEAGRWSRRREVEWQRGAMLGRPVGGEAVASSPPIGCMRAAEEMAKLHLCYLNSAYHKKQLDFWRRETVEIPGCWRGVSGYDYIGRHLGPRFVIQDAKKAGGTLRVVLQNRGFSGVCRETDCLLVKERADGGREELPLDADVGAWHSGKKIVLPVPLPPEGEGPLCLSLALRRRGDRRTVRFANKGAGGAVRLGWLEN